MIETAVRLISANGVAAFSKMQADKFQQVLLTHYPAGAPIGWHRDRPVFGEVAGISLLSPCTFRFRRKLGAKTGTKPGMKWERFSMTLVPRSVYLMSGPSRTEWEHSIPEVEHERYSITFRNFR